MKDDWNEASDLLAAGTSCPMPDCGALTIAYRPTDRDLRTICEPWEFTCPRCGAEFTAHERDLLFQSVREEWLRSGIHSA
jgi:hypothetical protein